MDKWNLVIDIGDIHKGHRYEIEGYAIMDDMWIGPNDVLIDPDGNVYKILEYKEHYSYEFISIHTKHMKIKHACLLLDKPIKINTKLRVKF